MKFIDERLDLHPDYAVGEPIPRVEPRVNQEVHSAILRLSRWGLWFLGVYFAISFVLVFVPVGVGARIAMFIVGGLFWCVQLFRYWAPLSIRGKDQWGIPFRIELKFQLISIITTCSISIPLWVGDGLGWIPWMGGGTLFFIGIYLIMYSLRACEPGQISCEKCSYALTGLLLPCVCPECGVEIPDLTGTTDRPRITLPGFRWIGSGMSILGLVIMLGMFLGSDLIYRQMPRSVLLNLAPTDTSAFVELIGSPMSSDERSTLIDEIIGANEHNGIWSRYSFEHKDWIQEQSLNGSMSREQFARILSPYDDDGVIVIDAPTIGRVGEPIEIGLLAKNLRLPLSPGFYFRGFETGEADESHAGSVYARNYFLITKGGREFEYQVEEGRNRPEFVLTPTEPGLVVIRARLVLVKIQGRTRMTAIDWELPTEEGFDKPVLWYRVIELEHTIEVLP